jgi:hypothetical protein
VRPIRASLAFVLMLLVVGACSSSSSGVDAQSEDASVAQDAAAADAAVPIVCGTATCAASRYCLVQQGAKRCTALPAGCQDDPSCICLDNAMPCGAGGGSCRAAPKVLEVDCR